jgi:hypothetical protein
VDLRQLSFRLLRVDPSAGAVGQLGQLGGEPVAWRASCPWTIR